MRPAPVEAVALVAVKPWLPANPREPAEIRYGPSKE